MDWVRDREEREAGYAADLAVFAQSWLESHSHGEAGMVIPLTAVSSTLPIFLENEQNEPNAN